MKTFYDEGGLAGVALDAVTGPQVFFAGFPLTGSNPGQAQDFLGGYGGEHDYSVRFTRDGSFAVDELGIILNEQRVEGAWLISPLLVAVEVLWRWAEWEYELPLEGELSAPDPASGTN